MTASAVDVRRSAARRALDVRLTPFWRAQLIGWSCYALALMIPWIGTYGILIMLPRKVVIGATGLLISAALRALFTRRLPAANPNGRVVTVVAASVTAGALWSALLALLLGGYDSDQVFQLGTLAAGIPQLSGVLYHALVMFSWSLLYIGIAGAGQPRFVAERPAAISPSTGPSGDLVIRDGSRRVVVTSSEVDWLEAEGDYVRIHVGPRNLLVRDKLSRIAEAHVPGFVRIHRSTIVNGTRVAELRMLRNRELEVTLRSGVKLRASRTYADDLRRSLDLR